MEHLAAKNTDMSVRSWWRPKTKLKRAKKKKKKKEKKNMTENRQVAKKKQEKC